MSECLIQKQFWIDLELFYDSEFNKTNHYPSGDAKSESITELEHFQSILTKIENHVRDTIAQEKMNNSDNPIFLPFSLFETMNFEQSEVHFTKTLSWFLTDNKAHGFKNSVLEKFLTHLKIDYDPSEHYSVEAEKYEAEKRKNRYDIMIRDKSTNGTNLTIVIEAKINASEGNDQIKRYENDFPSAILIFLTDDGRSPVKTKNKGRWESLKWKDIAEIFIEFLYSFKDKNKPEGYHLLRYYTASIIREIYDVRNESSKILFANCFDNNHQN